MRLLRALHGRRKSRRIQQEFDKEPLVFNGHANDLSFVDSPVGDLLSGGNYEIADAAALQFSGALDDTERIAQFELRCALCGMLAGACRNTPRRIVRDFASQSELVSLYRPGAARDRSSPCGVDASGRDGWGQPKAAGVHGS